MAKNSLKKAFAWVVGLAGSISLLAVSWGMITGTLFIAKVPSWITTWSGWLLFVLTLIGIVLGIVGMVKKSWR